MSGQINATTVAGTGAPGTITLARPRGVVLDADGYMFIIDCFNNRVVGQDSSGFRCILGCTNINGSGIKPTLDAIEPQFRFPRQHLRRRHGQQTRAEVPCWPQTLAVSGRTC